MFSCEVIPPYRYNNLANWARAPSVMRSKTFGRRCQILLRSKHGTTSFQQPFSVHKLNLLLTKTLATLSESLICVTPHPLESSLEPSMVMVLEKDRLRCCTLVVSSLRFCKGKSQCLASPILSSYLITHTLEVTLSVIQSYARLSKSHCTSFQRTCWRCNSAGAMANQGSDGRWPLVPSASHLKLAK